MKLRGGIEAGLHHWRPQGILHHWHLDGGYADSVQPGWTFVPQTGTPTFEAAVYNQGVRVDPANEELLVTGKTAASIDGAGSFTASGWAKQNAAASHWALFHAVRVAPFQNAWFIDNSAFRGDSQFWLLGSTGGTLICTAPQVVATDQWVFHCGVYDTSADTAVYYVGINGGALNSYASVEAAWPGSRFLGHTGLRSCYFLVGDVTVDDLRIYPVALTAAQVQTLYSAGNAVLGI